MDDQVGEMVHSMLFDDEVSDVSSRLYALSSGAKLNARTDVGNFEVVTRDGGVKDPMDLKRAQRLRRDKLLDNVPKRVDDGVGSRKSLEKKKRQEKGERDGKGTTRASGTSPRRSQGAARLTLPSIRHTDDGSVYDDESDSSHRNSRKTRAHGNERERSSGEGKGGVKGKAHAKKTSKAPGSKSPGSKRPVRPAYADGGDSGVQAAFVRRRRDKLQHAALVAAMDDEPSNFIRGEQKKESSTVTTESLGTLDAVLEIINRRRKEANITDPLLYVVERGMTGYIRKKRTALRDSEGAVRISAAQAVARVDLVGTRKEECVQFRDMMYECMMLPTPSCVLPGKTHVPVEGKEMRIGADLTGREHMIEVNDSAGGASWRAHYELLYMCACGRGRKAFCLARELGIGCAPSVVTLNESYSCLHLAIMQARDAFGSANSILDGRDSREIILAAALHCVRYAEVSELGEKVQRKNATWLDVDSATLSGLTEPACFLLLVAHFIVVGGGGFVTRDYTGKTPLHLACMMAMEPVALALIIREPQAARMTDSCGQFPLHYAGRAGIVAVTRVLVFLQGFSGDVIGRHTKMIAHNVALSLRNKSLKPDVGFIGTVMKKVRESGVRRVSGEQIGRHRLSGIGAGEVVEDPELMGLSCAASILMNQYGLDAVAANLPGQLFGEAETLAVQRRPSFPSTSLNDSRRSSSARNLPMSMSRTEKESPEDEVAWLTLAASLSRSITELRSIIDFLLWSRQCAEHGKMTTWDALIAAANRPGAGGSDKGLSGAARSALKTFMVHLGQTSLDPQGTLNELVPFLMASIMKSGNKDRSEKGLDTMGLHRLKMLAADKKRLQGENDALKREVGTLRERLAAADSVHDSGARMREGYRRLLREKEAVDERVTNLKDKISKLDAQNARDKRMLSAMRSDKASLGRSIAKLKQQLCDVHWSQSAHTGGRDMGHPDFDAIVRAEIKGSRRERDRGFTRHELSHPKGDVVKQARVAVREKDQRRAERRELSPEQSPRRTSPRRVSRAAGKGLSARAGPSGHIGIQKMSAAMEVGAAVKAAIEEQAAAAAAERALHPSLTLPAPQRARRDVPAGGSLPEFATDRNIGAVTHAGREGGLRGSGTSAAFPKTPSGLMAGMFSSKSLRSLEGRVGRLRTMVTHSEDEPTKLP